jgi:pyruvate/2-oxoacid:ferredoxin oxidoreductase alpha subunit
LFLSKAPILDYENNPASFKEVIRILQGEGIDAGLIKIKSIRPFPEKELKDAVEGAEHIIVLEFNSGLSIGFLSKYCYVPFNK